MLDNNNCITSINKAGCNIFGVNNAEEIIGMSINSFYSDPSYIHQLVEAKLEGMDNIPNHFYINDYIGRKIPIKVILNFIRSSNGEIIGRLSAFQIEQSEKQKMHITEPISIFISYSHIDYYFIDQLSKDLMRVGYFVWIDEHEIDIGESIPRRIEQGIKQSDFQLLVLSPSSVTSRWVRKELEVAQMKEIESDSTTLLPLLLKDCEIPTLLLNKKYVDFRSNYDSALDFLKESLKNLYKKKKLKNT